MRKITAPPGHITGGPTDPYGDDLFRLLFPTHSSSRVDITLTIEPIVFPGHRPTSAHNHHTIALPRAQNQKDTTNKQQSRTTP